VYVSLKPGYEPSEEIQKAVSKAIEDNIGKIARPAHVFIVSDMPKTRSGKIMRRVLAPFLTARMSATSPRWQTPRSLKKFARWYRANKIRQMSFKPG
jgi:acyl-coenzyme A synthetase/AMP-(fatty) acid ligase